MTLRPAPRALLGLVAVPALLLAAGCSGSVSVGAAKNVDASDVEAQVVKVLDDQGTMRATVTVTSIKGTSVKFDVDAVPVLSAQEAASKAAEQLAAQVGGAAPDVTCPDDLVGTVGTTMVCTLSDAGETYDTTLTVTDDGGGKVGFDIQVADSPS